MANNPFKRTLMVILGAGLSLMATGGCTYDYFEDETNFLLHVPQIERGEITDFYVSFHKIDLDGGRHILTRKVSAPFDGIEGGVLRFKLLPGKYDISTFADYSPGSLTEGQHLNSSFKGERVLGVRGDGSNLYAAEHNHPRAHFLPDTQVHFLGTPEAEVPIEDDIDEEHKLKGEVVCRFRDLPITGLTAIRVSYKGLSTRYGFDGVFSRFSDGDSYLHTHLSPTVEGADIVIQNLLFPSSGMSHEPRDPLHVDNGKELELHIQFLKGEVVAGETRFTKDDFARLSAAEKPVDKNGNPLTRLVLAPRDKIMITFKGFTVIGIGLNEWNDPAPGDVTIH